jgi:hypothetical protein
MTPTAAEIVASHTPLEIAEQLVAMNEARRNAENREIEAQQQVDEARTERDALSTMLRGMARQSVANRIEARSWRNLLAEESTQLERLRDPGIDRDRLAGDIVEIWTGDRNTRGQALRDLARLTVFGLVQRGFLVGRFELRRQLWQVLGRPDGTGLDVELIDAVCDAVQSGRDARRDRDELRVELERLRARVEELEPFLAVSPCPNPTEHEGFAAMRTRDEESVAAVQSWRVSPVTALIVGWLMPSVGELMHTLARAHDEEI